MKQTEAQLLRLVLDYLAARHIFSLRMNSGVLTNPAGRPVTFGIPGMADVLVFPHDEFCTACGNSIQGQNLVLWLELKSATGKQSALQQSFQAQVEAEGHRYILVRSLEDVEAALS